MDNTATRVRFRAFVFALPFAALAGGPAAADGVADFYKDKTVSVTYPTGPGGTFHLYAELVRRHLGQYIPGNPTMILQNKPGAGGVTMNNYMAAVAPKDGTVLAEINPGTVTLPLLRKSKYDPRDFEWLGSVTVRTYVGALWHTAPVDTVEQMKSKEVVLGATGTGSLNYQIPTLMNNLLGTKIKLVTGYRGGGQLNLAIERSEIQGRANYYSGFTGAKPDWIRDKKLKFFFRFGAPLPDLAGVPELESFFADPETRQMLGVLKASLDVGQAFFMPPGTPKDRVTAMADAFDKMLKDDKFLAEAKQRGLRIDPRSAAQVDAAVAAAFKAPPELTKKLAGAIGFK